MHKESEEGKETQCKENLSIYLTLSIHGHGNPIYIPPIGEAGLTEKEIACESNTDPHHVSTSLELKYCKEAITSNG